MAREKSRNKLRHRKAESEQWRQSRDPTPPTPNQRYRDIQKYRVSGKKIGQKEEK